MEVTPATKVTQRTQTTLVTASSKPSRKNDSPKKKVLPEESFDDSIDEDLLAHAANDSLDDSGAVRDAMDLCGLPDSQPHKSRRGVLSSLHLNIRQEAPQKPSSTTSTPHKDLRMYYGMSVLWNECTME